MSFDSQLSKFSYQNTLHSNQHIVLYVALPPKEASRNISLDFKSTKTESTITIAVKGQETPIFNEKLTCLFQKEEDWTKTGDALTLEMNFITMDARFQGLWDNGAGFYLIDREICKNEISDEEFWSDDKFNASDYTDYEHLMTVFPENKEQKEKNMSDAVAKLISAANKGNLAARELLAGIYSSEEQCKTWKLTLDFENASLYRKLAAFDNDDTYALFLFGTSSMNEAEAIIALERASRKGFAPAIHHLGELYESKGDYKKSIQFYQIGFSRGHSKCALSLQRAHLTGNGVNKSMEYAKEYKQFARNWDPLLNTFDDFDSVVAPLEQSHDDILEATLEELTHQTAILDPTNFTPMTAKSVSTIFDFVEEAPLDRIKESPPIQPIVKQPVVQEVIAQPIQSSKPVTKTVSPVIAKPIVVSKPSVSSKPVARRKKQHVIEEELEDEDLEEDDEDYEDEEEEEEEQSKPSETIAEKGFVWNAMEKGLTFVAPTLFAIFVYKRFTQN
jgi:hypothetical protein